MFGMDDYSQPISFDDGQAEKTIVVDALAEGHEHRGDGRSEGSGLHAAAVDAGSAEGARRGQGACCAEGARRGQGAGNAEDAGGTRRSGGWRVVPQHQLASRFYRAPRRQAARPDAAREGLVTPGTHTVLFVNSEESLKKSVSVTVGAGETKAVSAKLRD